MHRHLPRAPILAQEERPASAGAAGAVPFQAHVELLQFFLAHREHIVERIQVALNAQRQPPHYLQDRPLLFRRCEDGFFTVAGITPDQARLRGQLEEVHWARGFRPREIPGLHNGLIDPAEMMVRGFHLWQQTRWPGRNGRIRYAHTLFNLYMIRCLELLSMRVWDDGGGAAGARLAEIQALLDRLWSTSPADQPMFVRDARWLIQLAQSPATDDLGAYFDVAETIAEGLPDEDRLAIHRAGVRMAGGHLRSQIRYYCLKRGVPLDESSLVLSTRNSNALDFALLIQDFVPLLAAYEQAWQNGDRRTRLELADAICQGLSPDPELFLNRVDLLRAYSMIEHLFITADHDGQAAYTPAGHRHVQLVQEYQAQIGRLAAPLLDDCLQFRPAAGVYSPYGILYGFTSDLIEHMALRILQPDAVTDLGLEDVFVADDAGGPKLAWVNGWRKLPHITPEVARLFEYPQPFADDIFNRLEQALRKRVSDAGTDPARSGRLIIQSSDAPAPDAPGSQMPELPIKYIRSSDRQTVAAHRAVAIDQTQLLRDRHEGKWILSYETPAGWVAITKDILTEVLGAGQDVRIIGLPQAAVDVLKLMCADLAVAPQDAPL